MTPHMHVCTWSCLWPHLPSHLDLSQPCCHLSQPPSPSASVWTFCLGSAPVSPLELFETATGSCPQQQSLCAVPRSSTSAIGEPPWLPPYPPGAAGPGCFLTRKYCVCFGWCGFHPGKMIASPQKQSQWGNDRNKRQVVGSTQITAPGNGMAGECY